MIGDSLNPLADAVRSSSIEWIGVRHEEGAALAASGQAKLTGRLAVCAGTTGPGSTHLVAALYEASRDQAPVLALSGDMPRKMQGLDYMQTTKSSGCDGVRPATVSLDVQASPTLQTPGPPEHESPLPNHTGTGWFAGARRRG